MSEQLDVQAWKDAFLKQKGIKVSHARVQKHEPDQMERVNGTLARTATRWYEERVEKGRTYGRFAEFGSLTPQLADILLEHNAVNRPISPGGVNKWMNALRAGDWQENGETIKIAVTGELNDGQHRCLAVQETGVPMPTLFVFGLQRETRKTVDVGAKRAAAHMFAMDGVPQGKLIAAAISKLINIEAKVSMNTDHSFQEIERSFALHPDILEDCADALTAARNFKQSQAAFVAIHYLYRRRHAQKAMEFFRILADGTAPHPKHACAMLRNRLTENLKSKAKLPATEVAALVIKAIQSFDLGKPVGNLRWTNKESGEDGKKSKPEAFPTVP